MRLLLRAGLRHHARHWPRSLLSVFGIALGVALVLGMDLAITGVRGAFDRSVDALSGAATHRVVGGPSGLDDEVYRKLRVDHGRTDVAPIVESDGVLIQPDLGSVRLFGIDPYADGALRSFYRRGEGVPLDRFVGEPGTVSVSEGLGPRVGDQITVRVRGFTRVLTVVGTFAPEDPALLGATERILVVDVATAQEALGQPGKLTRLEVLAPNEESLASLRSLLPEGVTLQDVGEYRRGLDRMVAAFDLNLRFLSLLALVVAAFLIHNTMTFSVVERRGQIGRLRAHGALPGEVVTVTLLESAGLALLGSALGIVLGRLLATGLTDAVATTVNDLYFDVTVPEVALGSWPVVRALGAGTIVALFAALGPAMEAARLSPRAAMRRSELEESTRKRAGRRALLSVPLVLAGVLLFVAFPEGLWPCYVALLLIVLGFAAVVPAAVAALARILRTPLSWVLGFRGRLAAGGVIAGLSRTGIAVSALAVALAMALGVSLMVRSFRGTVVSWLGQTLGADVYVSVEGTQSRLDTTTTLDDEVLARIRAVEGVERLSTNRTVDVDSDRGSLRLVTFGATDERGLSLTLLDQRPDTMTAYFAGEAALASEPLSNRLGLSVGDELTLVTDAGKQTVTIAGVFRDYASDRGYLTIHRSLYDRFYDDRSVSALGLHVAPDADADVVAAAVRESIGDRQAVLVRTQRSVREASMQVFDRTFAVTSVLHVLAVVVAFVGIILALMAFQLERAGELAVLRARGLTGREVFVLVGSQTFVLGLTAGLMAIPLGMGLAAVLIYEVNLRSFGWSLPLVFEVWPLLETVGLAIGAAVLAGLPPAWALLGQSPAEAMRREEVA